MSSIVDFHTHILPAVDDGSESIRESILMLKAEAKQGIAHVIATPHFYAQHDSPERFLRRREAAQLCLRDEMSRYSGLPKLSIGAEVYYFSGISDSEVLQELTISGIRCILIEMPVPPWSDQMYRELEGIWVKQRLLPILAHVDRYISVFRTFQIPERICKLPVFVQANASFFLHRTTAPMALRMLKNDRIHLLGSDCHNLTDRAPNLGEALKIIEKRLGREAVSKVAAHQNKILNNIV